MFHGQNMYFPATNRIHQDMPVHNQFPAPGQLAGAAQLGEASQAFPGG